jgi:hypothetical protein
MLLSALKYWHTLPLQGPQIGADLSKSLKDAVPQSQLGSGQQPTEVTSIVQVPPTDNSDKGKMSPVVP